MSGALTQPNKDAEIQLIIECSQTSLNSQQIARISHFLERSLDWDYLFHTAAGNGLLPLVCWNLLRNFEEKLSAELQNRASALLQTQTEKNLFLTKKLLEVIRLLNNSNIPVLPFKGTTLALRAYKNLAHRQYVDLDILVQPKDFDNAVEILLQNDYKPISSTNRLKRSLLFFTNKKDIGLISADKKVRVELHWKLSGSHFSMPLEIDRLWNRLEKLNLGGFEVNALPFNDLFIYLCLHGSRHAWEKFSWICDLNELIRAEQEAGRTIDWREINRHARELGCEKVVELGLFLVHEFYQLKTEYPEFDKILDNRSYQQIAAKVLERNFAEQFVSSELSDWYMYHLALKEKKFDKVKLHLRYFFWYLKIIFTPNSMDKAVFHLPTAFYPLYFVLRPLRLLFMYLSLEKRNVMNKR